MRLLLVALVALALVWPAAAERLVTDSAGREVAVPDQIERVFAAGPPASILLYEERAVRIEKLGDDLRLVLRAATSAPAVLAASCVGMKRVTTDRAPARDRCACARRGTHRAG